jgi:two-component system chemotaxis sensor kinase CheA
MSRPELLRLIFLPGFSTSDRVTQFSGRGVGMDVVRTNIEKIGGVVDLESVPGQGTTIRAKIPLTLAIIPALIVVSGDERYAIPQVSLLELVRIEADDVTRGIERVQGAPVYRLRGALLPLVFLDEQLQLAVAPPRDRDLNIVVVQADDRPFGLVVDAIRDTEEIVAKPLQKQLKGIGVFAGAAIMGDGRVALVLDVLGLAQRSKVISGAKNSARADCERSPAQDEAEIHSLLCFEPRDGGQMAIPLERVTRLEEFSRSKFERLGDRQVIQYRGGILPLVDVSRELRRLTGQVSAAEDRPKTRSRAVEGDDAVPVVVCEIGEDHVGLVVGRILDIVDERIPVRSRANRPGVSFTAVVQERVTEFIDVDAIVRDATSNVSHPVA